MGDHIKINIEDDQIEDDVSRWTPEDVAVWLGRKGYKEYMSAAVNCVYPVNGDRLLSLTRSDLMGSPFHMQDQAEADHLNSFIEALRKSQLTKYMKKIELNGIRNGYSNGKNSLGLCNGRLQNGYTSSKTSLTYDATQHHSINDTTPLIPEAVKVIRNCSVLSSDKHPNLHGSIHDHRQNLRASRSDPSYTTKYTSANKPEKCLSRTIKLRTKPPPSTAGQNFTSALADRIRTITVELVNMCKRARQPVEDNTAADRSSIVIMESWDSTSSSENLTTERLNLHGEAGEDLIGNSSGGSTEQYPVEKVKTLVALIYMLFGFVVSVVTLQFVHDRVPSMTEDPPLPDIFFDIVPRRIEGAFSYCESIGMILTSFTILIAVFHKHRFIIMRRVFFILGTLYLYRSITIYVTTLPVPGLHFKCAPKAHGHVSLMLMRAVSLLFGGGLSVTGSHHLCGDYLFSGHTIMLVITYMTLHEYTPKRWWFLHWVCWLMSSTGIVCILLAHDHYTIDVVIAYLLTTRLFWTYHTLCNVAVLKEYSNSNLLSRAWWFPLFRYFEENVNSTGCLPRQFEWPLPWPRRLRSNVVPGRRSPIKGV